MRQCRQIPSTIEASPGLFKRFRKDPPERKEGGEGHYHAACEIVKLRALDYSAEGRRN